jgi:hypothetical protein
MTALLRIETAQPEFIPDPISDDEAAAMFRAALNLFRLWRVTDEQAATLLDLPLRSYRRWKAGEIGRISRDGKARLSNLMGVHKALRLIFRNRSAAMTGSRPPTPPSTAARRWTVMLGGELTDLMRVRRYLDAERGGW